MTLERTVPALADAARAARPHGITEGRRTAGRVLFGLASLLLVGLLLVQGLSAAGVTSVGFANWRPVLYGFIVWSIALGAAQVLIRGEKGERALFLLPALLFTIAVVIFPTVFGLYIAFTDWNLSSLTGRHFNGLDNLRTLFNDSYFWNALTNMGFYLMSVIVQYAIAFGLAMLLNADIRARKFFRVTFLIPLMLSPVAVSWMVGKSILEYRYGPVASLIRDFGFVPAAFFASPWLARISIMAMDGWTYVPFLMIMLLAGLQALPGELLEAAKIDGAKPWQAFWQITFPLMLPVSVTALVLRIIFELKLADLVINLTSGGPGGATDTVSSFVYRTYRDRSAVGYGTMIAEVYLVVIIVFMTILLNIISRVMRRYTVVA